MYHDTYKRAVAKQLLWLEQYQACVRTFLDSNQSHPKCGQFCQHMALRNQIRTRRWAGSYTCRCSFSSSCCCSILLYACQSLALLFSLLQSPSLLLHKLLLSNAFLFLAFLLFFLLGYPLTVVPFHFGAAPCLLHCPYLFQLSFFCGNSAALY